MKLSNIDRSCELVRNSLTSQLNSSQACEPRFQWLGPFYHRSRETDRLRRAAVSWWFTKPEDLSFIFDPGSIASSVVGEAPGPKVDLDQASDEQLRNLAAIAEIVDDSEEDENVAKSKPLEQQEGEGDVVDWATVGARLIAHAERVREEGSWGNDWMSRYAEDYAARSEDHDLEFPELPLPHEIVKPEEAKDDGGDGDDPAEMERLQELFDKHLRESYPTMDGDFSGEYKKWSATCDGW